MSSVDYLQQCIDLSRRDIELELFAVALAVRYVHELITYGGSEMRRPDLESALHPEYLEFFLARAEETAWNNARIAQEWRKLQQALPLIKEAWKKGQSLFQEALEQAKSHQESLEYLSMIDLPSIAMPTCQPTVPIPTTLRFRTGRSMGICSLGERTFSRIRKGQKVWKGVSDDILF
jgi:hypothetical protein